MALRIWLKRITTTESHDVYDLALASSVTLGGRVPLRKGRKNNSKGAEALTYSTRVEERERRNLRHCRLLGLAAVCCLL